MIVASIPLKAINAPPEIVASLSQSKAVDIGLNCPDEPLETMIPPVCSKVPLDKRIQEYIIRYIEPFSRFDYCKKKVEEYIAAREEEKAENADADEDIEPSTETAVIAEDTKAEEEE